MTEYWRELLEAARGEWLDRARAMARQIAIKRGVVTSDDLWKACPPPAEVDPRVMGAVFQKEEFTQVGYVKSKRTACHKRPIGQWVLK